MFRLAQIHESVEIGYTYDALGRLTAADYDTGTYFHYEYDAVGNRLEEAKTLDPLLPEVVTTSVYDAARGALPEHSGGSNRLVSAGGVSYTWDNNGNLLSDGVNTYSYDHANRLTAVSNPQSAISYQYNGQGDRLSQTVNSVTTRYTLDLNAGLTQVLDDGNNTYVYGVNRIAQVSETQTGYFLPDAIGSVRNIADEHGAVTLTQSYTPYGEVMASEGTDQSAYAFTGESYDPQTGLVYLRARYYAVYLNQFIQADNIVPDPFGPADWNKYLYVRDNPVRFTDPSGFSYCDSIYANPDECDAPNIHSYNEKFEPESISWISNQFGDNVTRYLAPLYDRNGQIVYRTNAAQFLIDGHEMSCDYIQVPTSDGKLQWVCPDGGVYNQNLCGQVTVSAIVYLFDANITARKIVEQMGVDKRQTTGYGTLQDFLNQYYKKYLYAETKTLRNLGMDSSQLPNYLGGRIAAGNLVVSGITIKYGGSNFGGRVNPSGNIGHWVMITGISREWKNSDEFSPWNWVRIFNPFDNETEYYWWGDFGPAWSKNTNNQYTMLLINPHQFFRNN